MSRKKRENPWIRDNISDDIAKVAFRLKVTLENGAKIDQDITPDISIDLDDLCDQMQELPSAYAFYSMAWAQQKFEVAKLERMVKRRRGKIVETLREEARLKSTKITDKSLQEMIEADDKLLEIQLKKIKAERTESKLYAVISALRMKSEMIRTISADKRQEMRSGDLRVMSAKKLAMLKRIRERLNKSRGGSKT